MIENQNYKRLFAIVIIAFLFAIASYSLAQVAQDTADSANNTANSVNTSSFQNMSTVDELKVNRISKNNVWDGYLGGYYIELNSRIHCIFNMCDFTSKNNYGGLTWYEPQDIQLYWGNKSISLDNTSAHIKNASLDMHGNTIINSPSLIVSESNESYSYLIFSDGINYYAKNGSSGVIDYSGIAADIVSNNAITAMPYNGKIIFYGNITTETINLKSNINIEIQGLIKRIDNAVGNSVFNLDNVSNVNIYNANIDGNKLNNTKASNSIRIISSNNINIFGGKLFNSTNDSVYIGNTISSHDIRINDVSTHDNLRNGVAIVNGFNIFINNLITYNNTVTGLDLEPNSITDNLNNIFINGLYAENNNVSGLYLFGKSFNQGNVFINNFVIQNNYGAGGITIRKMANIIISNGQIYHNDPDGIGIFRETKELTLKDIVINNNLHYGVNFHPSSDIDNSTDLNLNNLQVYNNGQDHTNFYDGIALFGGDNYISKNITITNSRSYSDDHKQRYNLNVGINSTNVKLDNFDTWGAATQNVFVNDPLSVSKGYNNGNLNSNPTDILTSGDNFFNLSSKKESLYNGTAWNNFLMDMDYNGDFPNSSLGNYVLKSGSTSTGLQILNGGLNVTTLNASGNVVINTLTITNGATPQISSNTAWDIRRGANQRIVFTSGGTGYVGIGTGSLLYPPQSTTAPSYSKGALYYNTTDNKLYIGGATEWETINNASIQINESQVTNLQTDLNAKVNKTGDTMTGDLTISPGTLAVTTSASNIGTFTSSDAYPRMRIRGSTSNNIGFLFKAINTDIWSFGTSNNNGGKPDFTIYNEQGSGQALLVDGDTNAFYFTSLTDTKTTALCIDANEKIYRSTNATSGYLTC